MCYSSRPLISTISVMEQRRSDQSEVKRCNSWVLNLQSRRDVCPSSFYPAVSTEIFAQWSFNAVKHDRRRTRWAQVFELQHRLLFPSPSCTTPAPPAAPREATHNSRDTERWGAGVSGTCCQFQSACSPTPSSPRPAEVAESSARLVERRGEKNQRSAHRHPVPPPPPRSAGFIRLQLTAANDKSEHRCRLTS